jgi:hypothetical protein
MREYFIVFVFLNLEGLGVSNITVKHDGKIVNKMEIETLEREIAEKYLYKNVKIINWKVLRRSFFRKN